MKVNKVFCYSNEVATSNKKSLKISGLFLRILCIVLLFAVPLFMCPFIFGDDTDSVMKFMMFYCFFMTAFFIFYAMKKASMINPQLISFVIDDDSNLYYLYKDNKASSLTSVARASTNSSVKIASTIKALNLLNSAANFMSDQNNIREVMENIDDARGINIYQILNIRKCIVKNNKTVIYCDFVDYQTKKQKQNKKITIYNVYESYDELVQYLRDNASIN